MLQKKKYLLILLAALPVLLKPATAADTTFLKIIVTTDLHGHILPYDPIERSSRSNSLAQVYSFVMNEREQEQQEVILLDNGDLLQGDPLVYYYNFIDTSGMHPVAQIMNFMQYDAATIGNHDIEAGPRVYDKLTAQFDFPWLGANIIDEITDLPYFKPYTIIERNNLKIAVLGLCTPSVPNWLPEELWRGMQFDDMLVTARNWVRHIQKNEKPDLLIGLFHSGAPLDDETGKFEKYLENASRVIARQVDGFDIIFSGHDHRRWNEFVTNEADGNTLLLGGGSHARNLAVADITLISDNATKSVRKKLRGSIPDMTLLPAHAGFLDKFFSLVYPVKDYVEHQVGMLNDTLMSRYALFGSNAFVNLVHHIQLDITGADVSFSAPLSYDVTIPPGILTRGDLFKLYRFENQLYTMDLTGQEIADVLEYSYGLWMNQMQNKNDHLIRFRSTAGRSPAPGPYGRRQTATPHFNFESAAGIVYTVDVSKQPGSRVNIASFIDGDPFYYDSVYSVAINSYRASGGGGHLTEGAGILHSDLRNRITWTSGKDLRRMLMEWIKKNNVPLTTNKVQWSVIPAEWHARGKAKDYELMFGNR